MKHWSVDTKKFRRYASFPLWQLEQRINFGIGKKRIPRRTLVKYWDALTLDPQRRKYLAFLLWGKTSSQSGKK